jgi:hypothetical protein
MKLIGGLVVLVVLVLSSNPVYADGTPIALDVTATACETCIPGATYPPVVLDAIFTVEQVTATYFDSGFAFYFTGTEDEVVSISGTLDGAPISLASPTFGDGSWLNSDFSLGTVYFTFGGQTSWLENDGYNRIEIADVNGDGYGSNIPILWNAVPAPEPASFALLVLGLVGIAVLKLRRAKTRPRSPV